MIDITQPLMRLMKDGVEISRHTSAVEAMERAAESGPGTYTLVRPDATIVVDGVEPVEPEPEPPVEPPQAPEPVDPPVDPSPSNYVGKGYTGLAADGVSAYEGATLDVGPYSLRYLGGFRLLIHSRDADGPYGFGGVQRSTGPIYVDGETLYVASHPGNYAVGTFPVLDPVMGGYADMPISRPSANWQTIKDGGWPFQVYITGIAKIGGEIVVNTSQFYDGDNSFRDAQTVLGTGIHYSVTGNAEASGWMNPIPSEWQESFGGDWLMGHASNMPINGRQSLGPSLFAWNGADKGADIVSQEFLGYGDMANPLGSFGRDPANVTEGPGREALQDAPIGFPGRANLLWNEQSRARIGFIRDNFYIVLGSQGGVDHGIGYKDEDENGRRGGGYGTYISTDNGPWFWVYDLNEILSAENPHEPRPIEYGPLALNHGIAGAAVSGDRLYIHYQHGNTDPADRIQNRYEPEPIILVYEVTQ
jgi:hypothetical protein